MDSSRGLSYSYDGAGATHPPTPPTSLASSVAIGAAAAMTSSAPHLHITTTTNPASSNHHPSARPQQSNSSPRGGTGGGGTNQACAACKYQRRKCNPDCPLAPYFPGDQQRRFLNAHRLFGVSNILKTLRRLKPELCDDAMRTLIYQAEMRAIDPVWGCLRVILELQQQLELDTAELDAVLRHLELCRHAATAGVMDDSSADLEVTSSNQQPLLLSAEQEIVDALYANQEADAATLQADHHHQDQSPQDHGEQQQLYDYFYYETVETTAGDDASSKPRLDINVNSMQLQHFDYDTSWAADHKVEQAPPPVSTSLVQVQQLEDHCQIDQKEYEMKAASLVDVFDMRQELHAVDMNADIDINAVIVDVNDDIDVKEELQEEEDAKNNMAVVEAAQMAESSHCRLGLGFSSF